MSSLRNSYSRITEQVVTAVSFYQEAIRVGAAGVVGNPSFSIGTGLTYNFGFTTFDKNMVLERVNTISSSGDFNLALYENADFVTGSSPMARGAVNQALPKNFLTEFEDAPVIGGGGIGDLTFGPSRFDLGDNAGGKLISTAFQINLILKTNTKYILEYRHNDGQTRDFNMELFFADISII